VDAEASKDTAWPAFGEAGLKVKEAARAQSGTTVTVLVTSAEQAPNGQPAPSFPTSSLAVYAPTDW
jgi:hypothetical protein